MFRCTRRAEIQVTNAQEMQDKLEIDSSTKALYAGALTVRGHNGEIRVYNLAIV